MVNSFIVVGGGSIKFKSGYLKTKPKTKQDILIERFTERLKNVKTREQRIYLEQLICDIKDNKKEVIDRFKLEIGGVNFGYTEK